MKGQAGRARAEHSGEDTWPEVGQEGSQAGWACAEQLAPRSFSEAQGSPLWSRVTAELGTKSAQAALLERSVCAKCLTGSDAEAFGLCLWPRTIERPGRDLPNYLEDY